MKYRLPILPFVLMAIVSSAALAATPIPKAIYTDPIRDKAHPARMEVVHIPSGDVQINGVVYVASGAGPHPMMIFFHGWPGNEKNLDLAQAVRRAGWNVLTLNYRGSWGSPGNFRFAQNLQDADAALAFVRDRANAAKLGIDPKRLVIAGHSMGGWVTAMTAEHDKDIIGAILISAANIGQEAKLPRAQLVALSAGNMESLNGVTAESMADDLAQTAMVANWDTDIGYLASTPLLVLTSDDGLAPHVDAMKAAIKSKGINKVTAIHVATDHSWSDNRIRLQSEVINWLNALPKKR